VGATVMRTHLRLSFSSLTSDTSPGVFYGIVLWDKSQTIGLPDVQTDLNVDWMIQDFVSPGTSEDSIIVSTSILYGESLDLKARRRLRELNDTPTLLFKNVGSASLQFGYMSKMLVALP
jgi:hypothetical protein